MESFLRIAQNTELADDREVQKLLQVASTTFNPSLVEQVKKILAVNVSRHQLYPFTSNRNSALVPMRNQVTVGKTSSGEQYAVTESELTKHFLTVGQSGTWKTTLFYIPTDQMSVPFWIFDLNQDYRNLTQTREDLLVLPWTELKFDPVKSPPGVSPRRWIQVFGEIIGHSTALLSGSKNYLMQNLIQLYRHYKLFEEVSSPYPDSTSFRK